MELLGRFSLLWASISAASCMWRITGSQPPPAPTLSLSPPDGIFVRGERVQLTCSPPERRMAEEFQFYKLRPDKLWDLQRRQKEDTWEASTAQLEPQSTFVCTYNEKTHTGELLQSVPSRRCVVSIELPPASLSPDPKYPIYLQGEVVTLTCSAPAGQQASGYIFYKEQQDQTLKELSGTGQGAYKAFRVNQITAGKYRCVYWMLLSGQEVRSSHSSLISVTMTERPHPPVFSVSPQKDVYGSGELISLMCSAPDRRQVFRITLLKESSSLPVKWLPSSWNSFTHTLPLLPQDGGRYSCRYQVVESGRELPSPKSNVISISVLADTGPEPSTVFSPAHTYQTTARVLDSPGAPTSTALLLTPSQPATEEHSHSAEPDRPATSVPSSSQPTLHDGISSRTDSQGSTKPPDSWSSTKSLDSWGTTKPRDPRGATKPFNDQGSRKTSTGSVDPGSTSQTRTVSKAEKGNGTLLTGETLLVAGCTAAGILFLVFLVWFLRKELKDISKRPSRSFWETLDEQHFRRMSRINHSSRTHPGLQDVSQDWGILPKSKPVSSKHGGRAKESKADDSADSGAEFEFPEIDLTYTFAGYPSSTFFKAESNSPDEDTHIY